MKKNVILFFPSLTEKDGKIYSYEHSQARHDDFISHFPQEKVQFFLMRASERHLGDNICIPNYKRVGNNWETNTQKVYGDIILGPHKDITWTNIFQNPINVFCRDKTHIEKLFPNFTFQSEICENYDEIQEKFFRVSSHIKVLKPWSGSKGNGILFCENIPKIQEIDGNFPYLIQEFFDTSDGFFGHPGVHDFRTIILNGKITGSFLRRAAHGSLTANVDKGAEIIDFWEDGVPPEIQNIVFEVDRVLQNMFPERYYSIDIGRGRDGIFKIFELNGNPMLSTPSIRKHLAQYILEKYLAEK